MAHEGFIFSVYYFEIKKTLGSAVCREYVMRKKARGRWFKLGGFVRTPFLTF
jgi:hypothetical protein